MSDELDPGFANVRPFDVIAAHAQSFAAPQHLVSFASAINKTVNKSIDRAKLAQIDLELQALAEAVQRDKWIAFCRDRGTQSFPSGVTYLSQFLAHDTFETLQRYEVFDKNHRKMVPTKLVLRTIYGDGPRGNKELFLFEKFNIDKDLNYQLPKFYGALTKYGSHPLLADQRNRDNPILMQIAFAFMNFHNYMVEKARTRYPDGSPNFHKKRFTYARIGNILTFHNIIREEIVETVCTESDAVFSQFINQSSDAARIALQGAAFRGFHSAVRRNYVFNTGSAENTESSLQFTSSEMLDIDAQGVNFGVSYSVSPEEQFQEWIERWKVRWELFLEPVSDSHNSTIFSPSFAFHERGKPISLFDFRTDLWASTRLPNFFRAKLVKVRQFYSDLQSATGVGAQLSTLKSENMTPLMLEYLIDGFYDDNGSVNPVGKLGPIASEIFRSSVSAAIAEAVTELDEVATIVGLDEVPSAEDLPTSFVGMLETMEKEESIG